MFFANPVAALRNVREALVPGGLLNMVVWRGKLDNEVMHRAELVVAEYLDEPEDSDAPRCGSGRSRWPRRHGHRRADGRRLRGRSALPPGLALQDRHRG
jgi:hypothetical protein